MTDVPPMVDPEAARLHAELAQEVEEHRFRYYVLDQPSVADGAYDTLSYSVEEIRRIVRSGFELAQRRRGKLTSVDKANVLDTSRLWRAIVDELAAE